MSVLVPVMFFIVFILGIAQSAITLKTYADTKKAQDTNYKFSIFTLVFSILGLLISGFMAYKAMRGGNPAASPAPAAAPVANTNNKLAAKLENLVEQIKQKAN